MPLHPLAETASPPLTRVAKMTGMTQRPPRPDDAHDVLAADEFAMPAADPDLHHGPVRLPEDPFGDGEPHDVLAAEEFPMPAGRPHSAPSYVERRGGDGQGGARAPRAAGGAEAAAPATAPRLTGGASGGRSVTVPSATSAAKPTRLRQRRVGVDGQRQVLGDGAHLDRQHHLGDQLAGARPRRCRRRGSVGSPGRRSSLVRPSGRSSDSARPDAAQGNTARSYATSPAWASVSVRPAQATSGSV